MPSAMGSNPLPEQWNIRKRPSRPPGEFQPAAYHDAIKPVSASNDMLIPAVGYVFWLLAVIALMGQNAKAKFHGAQALVYGLVMGLLYLPFIILSALLSAISPILSLVLGLGFLAILVLVPLFMAYKTYKGDDVLLPVIGPIVADKMGYKA